MPPQPQMPLPPASTLRRCPQVAGQGYQVCKHASRRYRGPCPRAAHNQGGVAAAAGLGGGIEKRRVGGSTCEGRDGRQRHPAAGWRGNCRRRQCPALDQRQPENMRVWCQQCAGWHFKPPVPHLYRMVVKAMMFSVPARWAKGWLLGKRRSSTCGGSEQVGQGRALEARATQACRAEQQSRCSKCCGAGLAPVCLARPESWPAVMPQPSKKQSSATARMLAWQTPLSASYEPT